MKEGKLLMYIISLTAASKMRTCMGLLEEVAELARQCLEMVGERRPSAAPVGARVT